MKKTDRYDYVKMARAIIACKRDAGQTEKEIVSQLPLMNARLVHLVKHEIIARQGDEARIFGLVVSGGLQMTIRAQNGDRCLMRVIRPGEFAGHSLLFQIDPVYPCDVVAYPSCDVIVCDLAAVRTWRKSPSAVEFYRMIEDQLSRSLSVAWQRGFIVSQHALADRVMAYLMIRSAEDRTDVITLQGSMDDFANFLACNRPALSRAISKLRAEGKIDVCARGRLRLLSKLQTTIPPELP